MNALVSVVIPTYNHAHFLGKAIKSVVDQTYSNWEMIIVDNHSTDDTDVVVSSFGDDRIQLLKIHNNGVIASSRNKGIKAAHGQWIAFLDSDDCWYSEKLEIALDSVISDNSIDVISTDELMINNQTGVSSVLRYGPYENDFYKVLLMHGNRLSPSATLVKRTFLEQHALLFNESAGYIAVEDYDLWLRLALNGAKFKFLPSVQGEYIIHPGNNSAQLLRQRKNFENLLRDHVFHIQTFHPSPAKLWESFQPMLQVLEVKQLLADKEKWKALNAILRSVAADPGGLTAYIYHKLKTTFQKKRTQ